MATIDETTITSLIAKGIQAVGAGIAGITAALDPAPNNLDSSQLPAQVCFTGSAECEDAGTGENWVTVRRTMRVQFAMMPTGQGNPEDREKVCRPMIDQANAEFRRWPQLKGVAYVQEASVISDSGIVILPEWGGKFIGFELRVRVEYIQPKNLAE